MDKYTLRDFLHNTPRPPIVFRVGPFSSEIAAKEPDAEQPREPAGTFGKSGKPPKRIGIYQ